MAGDGRWWLKRKLITFTYRYLNKIKAMKAIFSAFFLAVITCCTTLYAQNVGINTTTPVNKLQVGNVPSGISGYNFAIGNGTKAMAFKQATGPSIWYSDTNFAVMPLGSNSGYVGIGTTTPANYLQVGSLGSKGYNGYSFAFGDGTRASAMYQTAYAGNWLSSVNIALLPKDSAGSVGINTSNPHNTLQVGNVTQFVGGYSIAFGNASNGAGFVQNGSSRWFSTTNISLLPGGSYGNGFVGINTASPAYPLDVEGNPSVGPNNNYAILELEPGPLSIGTTGTGYASNVSIYASNSIVSGSGGVWAGSDERIKNVKGYSNSTTDLATLRAIKITDYTMKDKMSSGDRPFKKVIAQQVEGVYPQVIAKHPDFIPDVYQKATVTKSANGYLLTFSRSHNLGKGEKRLKVLVGKGMVTEKYNIISVPSDKEILVDAPSLKEAAVFVFGGEVEDFRTVDYDGLSTLNISATQELANQADQQRQKIEALTEKVSQLEASLAALLDTVKKLQAKQ